MHKHTFFLSTMLLTIATTVYTSEKAYTQNNLSSVTSTIKHDQLTSMHSEPDESCCSSLFTPVVTGCAMFTYVSAILLKACYNTAAVKEE